MVAGYKLDANEQVVQETGRHWIDLMPMVVSTVCLVAGAIGLAFIDGLGIVPTLVPGRLVLGVIVALIILAGILFVTGLWVYRQNKLIITNLHLIEVEQQGLFARKVSQLSLARVQDVSGHRRGFIATIFNYGDIEVQSAGEQDNFTFVNAPGPQELADACLQAHEQFINTNPDREM
ncbi:MAG TPA: PH domain-containing protein [Candidatus Saccharimonadia bacterium]|nr:PH domain-containing protein [Candidatus Saccharimonadia bacterium]